MGDWPCRSCGNWNWARRNECNKCFTTHPNREAKKVTKHDLRANQAVGLDSYGYGTAGRDAKRTGEAGGFKEFDDEEDSRRKRRAAEEKHAIAERKAVKAKCEFCKRFSCIC
uniref:RanBP2-type domain-containing protein n=1 Tax=Haptolina ericina TaxID=156174 RepID=A0A7S3BUR9_9EUKA|mmetsp:Transcript_68442/g.152774  ORF Transcript_68442/g.152774 Transcript_68442/m.152774 type:complete len:112 (+) Transcript_68442:322-657(+)